jgi:uncharacterized protein
MKLVGREPEIHKLLSKLNTDKSELIAILGRRRIGKTFLIRSAFEGELFFQFTGLFKSNVTEQLSRFSNALMSSNIHSFTQPKNWFEAFDILSKAIAKSRSKKKKVIFLDEFPWMATNKSRFLTAFTDFWNSFVSTRNDIVVIICGSSASWMINKVLKNKGGLHNRVTDRIILEPFTLHETQLFLSNKHIVANEMDIVKLYMALGGVPFYLDQIHVGESLHQAIDRICFKKGAILQLEYQELFNSLFENATKHKKIIEVLSQFPKGLTRDVIIKKCKLKTGGGVTTLLEELEHSGFISVTTPIHKNVNEKLYRLKDFYTLFYLKHIVKHVAKKENTWLSLFNTTALQTWSGYAFENVCLEHIPQIKRALKIEGITSNSSAWQAKGNDEMKGAQIDLLIDRADGIINLCEIKFANDPYIITGEYAAKLRLKTASFKHFTRTKKSIFVALISTYGIFKNKHSEGFVQNEINLKDLFKA